MKKAKTSSNHAKAPQSAAFVSAMRDVFGDVKVLYVQEGELTLGEEDTAPRASCLILEAAEA